MGQFARFEWLKSIWAVLAAFILGALIGAYAPFLASWPARIGDLYVTFLIMCVPPVMLTALTSSLARLLTSKSAGQHLQRIAVVFLISMLVVGAVAAIGMVVAKPGVLSGEAQVMVGRLLRNTNIGTTAGTAASGADLPRVTSSEGAGWGGVLLGLVPNNLFAAIAEGNYPQILFISILFGLLLGLVQTPTSERMLELVELTFELFQQAIMWSTYALPVAVLGIVANQVSQTGFEILLALARWIGVGIVVSLIVLVMSGLVLSKALGVSLASQWRTMRRPLTFALATSNSMAAMPILMDALEEMRLPRPLVRLIVPLNVMIARHGAIITGVMVFVFAMQIYDFPVNIGSLAAAVLGSVVVAAITAGMPGVPFLTALTVAADPMGLPLVAVIPVALAAFPVFDPFLTMAAIHVQAATTAVIIGKDEADVAAGRAAAAGGERVAGGERIAMEAAAGAEHVAGAVSQRLQSSDRSSTVRTTSPKLLLVVSLLISTILLSACINRATVQEQRVQGVLATAPDIKVAAVWPYASRGTLFWEGIQFALEEINERGGVTGQNIRIIKLDDHSSVTEGMAVAQSLAADPTLLAVIGHRNSFVALPAAEVYDRAGLVYIAPSSTAPELTKRGYARTFRMIPSDSSIGQQMADYVSAAGYTRIAIAYTDDAYGRGLAAAFEDAVTTQGAQIIDRMTSFGDVQQTRRTVAKWRAFDYNAIFVAATSPQLAQMVSLIRQAGSTAPIFGGDAFDSQQLLEVAGPFSEGVVFGTVFDAGQVDTEVRRFVQAFTERYNMPPDTWAAQGYDALHLFAFALEQADTVSPDAVASALRRTVRWRGVTGWHTFDETGEIIDKPIVYKTVQDGQFALLQQ